MTVHLHHLEERLRQAAGWGRLPEVLQCLEAAAGVDAPDKGGWTALIWAASNGHLDVVRALIAANANVNARTVQGWTALTEAAATGRTQVVEVLLAAQADHSIVDHRQGNTALMVAAQYGHDAAMRCLSAHGVDLNQVNRAGWTAAMQATWFGQEAAVAALVEANADFSLKNHAGKTALDMAREGGHTSVAALISQRLEATPALQGSPLGELYHGTPVPFEAFRDPTVGKPDRGAGYDHQGQAVYLTTDANGYGLFFARESCHMLALKLLVAGEEEESDRIANSDGVILSVQLTPDARVLDLDSAPAAIKELFANSVGDKKTGASLRQAVLDAGYDGIVFKEPNFPEGWEVDPVTTRTVAIYRHEKAIVTGSRDANDYRLARNWTQRGERGLAADVQQLQDAPAPGM